MGKPNSYKGVCARKRFGQHFLTDSSVLQQMVTAIGPKAHDRLIEIGPGRGALTVYLLDCLLHMDAVELDRDLIPLLEAMGNPGQLTVHQADVLQFNFASLIRDSGQQLRVVGNLPYNISTPLMFHIFESLSLIDDMHFLLQKEVAERMSAEVGSSQYGRLSVMTQYFCDVECLFDVGPEAFHPPPKVDSTFVRLYPHRQLSLDKSGYDLFSQLVSQVFTMRRKTLRKSLQSMVDSDVLDRVTIDLALRPQELSVKEFILLSQEIKLE